MGIATAVFPDAVLELETYGLAHQIAQNSPISIAGSKRVIQTYLRDPSLKSAPDIHELPLRSFLTADRHEGSRAFLERRRPVFEGR